MVDAHVLSLKSLSGSFTLDQQQTPTTTQKDHLVEHLHAVLSM